MMLTPLFLAVAVVAQAGEPKTEWKPFSSTGGKFSISLPGRPTEKKRQLEVGGSTAQLVTAAVRRGTISYSVSYALLEGADPEAAMDAVEADAATQAKGEIRDEKAITLGQVAGRETTIDIPKKVMAGGGVATVRLLVANDRVYAISATVPGARAAAMAAEVTAFFGTFRAAGVDLANVKVRPGSEAKTKAAAAPAGKAAASGTSAQAKGATARAKAGGAAPVAKKAGLVEFTPPDRTFVVKMPASPKQGTEQRGSLMGGSIETRIYSAALGSTTFLVSSERAEGHSPADPTSADRLLSIDRKIDEEVYKRTVRSQRKLMLGDAPGMEVELELAAGDRRYPVGGSMIRRTFIVGMTSFTVAAVASAGRVATPEVAEFLDSFEAILEGGKRTGRAAVRNQSWADYTPDSGEFTVRMPGRPSREEKSDLTGMGKVTRTTYSAELDDRTFKVEVEQYPGRFTAASGAQLLKIHSDTLMLSGLGLTVKSAKDIQVNGKPGREQLFEHTLVGGATPTTMIRRIVVDAAAGRVYTVEAEGPLGCQSEKAVQEFLQSFKAN